MATSTPKINKIIKLTEFDLLRTAGVAGNMYICMDSLKMYYDETDNNRVIYSYTGVKTVNDLMYNITPTYGTKYYCWEDNSLWVWMNKWQTIWSDSKYPSAYVYEDIPSIYDKQVLSDVYNYNEVLDNNGLLKDGSVVIRDRNRIIKGKLYVNDGNDNLVVSSYLGGGIRLLPNGKMDTDGELFISDENDSFIRSELTIKNNEEYIDYSEHPDLDTNEFQNEAHRYLVFHEGNLDASAIREITPEGIYNKLKDSSLPSPLELNVYQLNGHPIEDFSLVGHTHTASDVTDFANEARNQADVEIASTLNSAVGKGLDIIFNSTTKQLTLDVKDFTLSFGGGVSGYKTITDLSDTTINLTVDPDKHIHADYVDRMANLQTQINNIVSIDPSNYYTITQTDEKIAQLAATQTPTAGKPLLIDNDLKIPTTSLAADKISERHTVTFDGDITGTLITDWSSDSTVTLNAANIVSTAATPGKALFVNSNGDLPANAESASALNHTITINLDGEVTGSSVLDTSSNDLTIDCTLVPGDNILQTKDLNVTVAPLDNNGMIPATLIPEGAGGGLIPKGTFNPANGYPTDSPTEGDLYVSTGTGTIDGVTYNSGDWCVYLEGHWTKVSMSSGVTSVNNKTGSVTLTAEDVSAISTNLINYTPGDEIPNGYLVMTSAQGEITGAGIERLNRNVEIKTDNNSDIEVTSNSNNKSTNGTTDYDLNMMITQQGYDNIMTNTTHVIKSSGSPYNFRKYLNFDNTFSIVDNGSDTLTLSTQGGSSAGVNVRLFYCRYNDDTDNNLDDVLEFIKSYFDDRSSIPILLLVDNNGTTYKILLDDNVPDGTLGGYVDVYDYNNNIFDTSTQNGAVNANRKGIKFRISFTSSGAVSPDSLLIDLVTENVGSYLSTSKVISGTPATYLPTEDWQPATKGYVDSKLSSDAKSYKTTIGGQAAGTSYTVTHNLGTQNIIVQCRYTDTKEQCFIANTIVDNNKVTVTPDTAISSGAITVTILSIL